MTTSDGAGNDPAPFMAVTGSGAGARIARFFFMHLGTLVAVVVYFNLAEGSGWSADGVRSALLVGLVVKTGYMALAYWYGEHKHFDLGIWLMFAIGTVAAVAGIEPVFALFRGYSSALLFTTLALTAIVPLLAGREPFTYYYSRRQLPAWQLRTPDFHAVSRVVTWYWGVLFLVCAGLSAYAPRDWRFTFLYPNLLVVTLGLTAQWWLPALYFRLFPPGLPQAIEPLILGMPMVFDRRAAAGVRALIQFHVSGTEAGSYWLRIADGKCESFAGVTDAPDVTVHTPDTVWMRIAHGRLDGTQALMDGLYTAQGDYLMLAKLNDWFTTAR